MIIYKNNNSHSFTHILRENTTYYIGDALVIKVSECVELLRLEKLRVNDLTIQTYPTYTLYSYVWNGWAWGCICQSTLRKYTKTLNWF